MADEDEGESNHEDVRRPYVTLYVGAEEGDDGIFFEMRWNGHGNDNRQIASMTHGETVEWLKTGAHIEARNINEFELEICIRTCGPSIDWTPLWIQLSRFESLTIDRLINYSKDTVEIVPKLQFMQPLFDLCAEVTIQLEIGEFDMSYTILPTCVFFEIGEYDVDVKNYGIQTFERVQDLVITSYGEIPNELPLLERDRFPVLTSLTLTIEGYINGRRTAEQLMPFADVIKYIDFGWMEGGNPTNYNKLLFKIAVLPNGTWVDDPNIAVSPQMKGRIDASRIIYLLAIHMKQLRCRGILLNRELLEMLRTMMAGHLVGDNPFSMIPEIESDDIESDTDL